STCVVCGNGSQCVVWFFFFFFFQAEDGIRDRTVTGVQTCALPILPAIPGAREAVERLAAHWPLGLASSSNRKLIELALELLGVRSEERRVGKECRTPRSPHHCSEERANPAIHTLLDLCPTHQRSGP